MGKNNLEERIVELESRLAFQDDTIEELNGVIISQQLQLDLLEKEVKLLNKRLAELMGLLDGATGANIS